MFASSALRNHSLESCKSQEVLLTFPIRLRLTSVAERFCHPITEENGAVWHTAFHPLPLCANNADDSRLRTTRWYLGRVQHRSLQLFNSAVACHAYENSRDRNIIYFHVYRLYQRDHAGNS